MKETLTLVFALLVVAAKPSLAQSHAHLNAGALSQTQGAPLAFDNGADFITNSLYAKGLSFTNSGQFANLYQGNITLTALHATDPFGDPVPGGPAPGAFIVAEIVTVSGPVGGEFGFWETNSSSAPVFSIPVGTTNGNFRFDLSEAALGAGTPGGDPFGHIHGRRFTATKPGLYTVGFRLLDVSANGTDGGPIHTPSAIFPIYFQAGFTLLSLKPAANGADVSFAAPGDSVFTLQFSDDLKDWTDVQTFNGTDRIEKIHHDLSSGSVQGFYRFKASPIF
jgi:hypothetical protein